MVHDNQHNSDIQHNDTQHNDIQNNETQYNNKKCDIQYNAVHCYAGCQLC
jgi:hypothetical protein